MNRKPTYAELEQKVLALQDELADCKAREEGLRINEERYKQAVTNSPNPIFSVDQQGHICTWNSSCEKVFQYGQEIVGQSYKALFDKRDQYIDTQEMVARVFKKKTLNNKELTYRRKDGITRITVSRLYPVLDFDGEVERCVFANTDISERKQAEEMLEKRVDERTSELKKAKERLEKVNTGLQVLIDHRQEELRRLQNNVIENANKLITPYIEQMDKRRMGSKNRAYLEVIETALKELVSPFARDLASKHVVLTPTEIRVADLIRQGKTSKEIASLMNVSANAITVHRYNIRRRLGLLNKKVNLRAYLQSPIK